MNNDNRNNIGNNGEDRFSTLDIDGINDLYYQERRSAPPNKKQPNKPHNSAHDLAKIFVLLASIIVLIIIVYTAAVGILGFAHQSSAETTTAPSLTLPTTATSATTLGIIGTSTTSGTVLPITTETTVSTSKITTATTETTQTTQTTVNVYNPKYENAVIFIDAGHGGHDVGAIGELSGTEYYEKDINLSVALLLCEEHEKRGFTVVTSRDTDEFIELADRAAMAVDADAHMFISLHCNSFSDSAVYGPRMYYTARSGLTYNGEKFAQYFTNAFNSVKTKFSNMKSSRNYTDSSVLGKNKYYAVLCNTNMPSILIEMGFITSERDLTMLIDGDWQQEVAKAVADAVENAYNAGMVTKK
ncbi:MAG: N-acetylmuramoyl-L-alanine amidase [Clostridia bacterium]|nr:N-acetylmuramoyl-L-alanine amidase [Clostridia bacterium]